MRQLMCHVSRQSYSPKQIRRTMTVGELMDCLAQFDEDAKICLNFDGGYTYGGLTEECFEWDETGDDDAVQ